MNLEHTQPLWHTICQAREVALDEGRTDILEDCDLAEDQLHWLEHLYKSPAFTP